MKERYFGDLFEETITFQATLAAELGAVAAAEDPARPISHFSTH